MIEQFVRVTLVGFTALVVGTIMFTITVVILGLSVLRN